MGMTSALKLKQIMSNTRRVLAIEMLTAARALDCLRPLRSSPRIEKIRQDLTAICPPWTADRPLALDIEEVATFLLLMRPAAPKNG
jgi:histidine ammonia-lyase